MKKAIIYFTLAFIILNIPIYFENSIIYNLFQRMVLMMLIGISASLFIIAGLFNLIFNIYNGFKK